MNIRTDLQKEQRNDIISTCKETIEFYNKEHQEEASDLEKNRMFDELGEDDEDAKENGETLDTQAADNEDKKNRRGSLKLDNLDFDNPNEANDENSKRDDNQDSKPKKPQFIEEGYLQKKKPNQKSYDKRYFRIRNGFLYWYLTDRARESQNKIEIGEIEDVTPIKDTEFMISLGPEGEGKESKKYQFKTETKEERDLWVTTFRRELKQAEAAEDIKIETIKTGEGKKPLFKDYDEIKRREIAMQKAAEKKKQREEREAAQKKANKEKAEKLAMRSKTLVDNDTPTQPQPQKRVPSIRKEIDMSDASFIDDNNESATQKRLLKPFEQEGRHTAQNNCWHSFLVWLGIEHP